MRILEAERQGGTVLIVHVEDDEGFVYSGTLELNMFYEKDEVQHV